MGLVARALLTTFIQKLSAAARLARVSPPALQPASTRAGAGPGQSKVGDNAISVSPDSDPLVDDMHRTARELADRAAAVKAASGEIAALSARHSAIPKATSRAPGDGAEQLAMIAADLRSKSAFVMGAGQSLEVCIAAAALSVTELAAAISHAAHSSAHNAYLPALVEELAGRANLAIDRLGQGTLQIDEIVNFITRIALQTNVLALDTVVDAAREAETETRHGLKLIAGQAHTLAVQAEQVMVDIHALIGAIIVGANDARAVMCHARATIGELRDAMAPLREVRSGAIAMPQDAHQRLASGKSG